MAYNNKEALIVYLKSLSIRELEKLLYKDSFDSSKQYLFPNVKREDYQLIREILHEKYIETPKERDC